MAFSIRKCVEWPFESMHFKARPLLMTTVVSPIVVFVGAVEEQFDHKNFIFGGSLFFMVAPLNKLNENKLSHMWVE